MRELDALAELQALDTRLDQLAHRREHLPEREQIAALDRERADLAGANETTGAERHQLERRQRALEDDVAGIEAKKATDRERMYQMTSPKDLSALQDELDSLERRQATLEDEILELMEQIEPLTAEIERREARLGEIEVDRGRLEAAVAVAEAEIDAETTAVRAQRDTATGDVPDDLRARYESLRERSRDGVVVGRIRDGGCSACGLRLSSVFMDEVRHSDRTELLQCEECGVLLVP